MTTLINPNNELYSLGVANMDATHLEFIQMVNLLGSADKKEFLPLFSKLLEHTEAHFEAEFRLMKFTRFPAEQEHCAEHSRLLSDLKSMNSMLQRGSYAIAKAFIKEQIPDWFHLHATTMDSALAAHVLKCHEAIEELSY